MVQVNELGVTWQALPEAVLLRDEDTPIFQMSVDLTHHDVLKHLRADAGQRDWSVVGSFVFGPLLKYGDYVSFLPLLG